MNYLAHEGRGLALAPLYSIKASFTTIERESPRALVVGGVKQNVNDAGF